MSNVLKGMAAARAMAKQEYRTVFGFRHVTGVPTCPCADPGNYLRMEQSIADPMKVRFTCWCGRSMDGRCESQEELDALLAQAS